MFHTSATIKRLAISVLSTLARPYKSDYAHCIFKT